MTQDRRDGVSTLTIARDKVNALNLAVVDELREAFTNVSTDAVVLTGRGDAFFSFGFDVPHYRDAPRAEFREFVIRFCSLCDAIFTFPRPVIAAINGHAIAGGCMLALACDYRVMRSGRARISLNEIGFGSTVFAGSTEMLRFAAGSRVAQRAVTTAAFYDAGEALQAGIVDAIDDDVVTRARAEAIALNRAPAAYASLKRLVRLPVASEYRAREQQSIEEFLDIWYSDDTQRDLRKIEIRV